MANESLAPGELIRETYMVVGPLGRGGMGHVYEVEHARLSGRYALKLLHSDRADDPNAVDRFRREAEIASALRHPHIVQVIDFDTMPDGAPFLVMERLEGEDLKSHLRRTGPLPVSRVVTLVDQIASALSAAHEGGVVHRDLKPENLFLARVAGQDGDFIKVLDFGISKVRAATTRLTGDRTVLGTPHYMAPEQARGRSDDIDGRADEFALGAIAYEMLAGEEAFVGEDASVILYRVVHETPLRLAAAQPPLASDAVDAVLRRALAKDPNERFATVREFARALAEAARAHGGVAGADLRDKFERRRGSSTRWVLAVALGAAAATAAGVWRGLRRSPAPIADAPTMPAPAPAPKPAPMLAPPSAAGPPAAGTRPAPASKPAPTPPTPAKAQPPRTTPTRRSFEKRASEIIKPYNEL